MQVERSMHPDWLSNAYLLAVEGGPAVFVDSGADVAWLVEAVERWRATPVALLRTHAHGDHVEHEDELVRVGGRDATLVVWSPDYDGKGKAWVRYDDGSEATVGGSRVERG